MENKKQLDLWDDESRCLRLQKLWGYDEIFTDPLRTEFLRIINQMIDGQAKPPTILDVGCGSGANLWAWKGKARLIGLDYSEIMLELTKDKFKGYAIMLDQGSCWEMPYKDNAFDIVVQMDVCLHLGGSWESIQEMIRVAKKYVVFTGPSFENWKNKMSARIEGKLSWGISLLLLEKQLDKKKKRKEIKNYFFLPRPKHGNITHKILVIEK